MAKKVKAETIPLKDVQKGWTVRIKEHTVKVSVNRPRKNDAEWYYLRGTLDTKGRIDMGYRKDATAVIVSRS